MQVRKTIAGFVIATAALTVAVHAGPHMCPPYDPQPNQRRPVDLVICLDTSGSMTQLIDSARARLWDIVNELARAKPTPDLRVGLLTFGSPNVSSPAMGWVLKRSDLTNDLDYIYSQMMPITTNGGEEFVGRAVHEAVTSMNWSRDPQALRIIYVAGNESADQDARFTYRAGTSLARHHHIIVNAIYCGEFEQGIREQWEQVACSGGGEYAAIHMDAGVVQIPTPYDQELLRLNIELNATYLPFGDRGAERSRDQSEMDKQAGGLGLQSAAERVVAKSTLLYENESWDLVDYKRANKDDAALAAIPAASLPPQMQNVAPEKREEFVEQFAQRRADVQRQIQSISLDRKRFLQEKQQQSPAAGNSLDQAVIGSLRKQAQEKGFTFE